MLKQSTVIFFLVSISFLGAAQNFDYSFVKANSDYAFLDDSVKTTIDSAVWDNNIYSIPIVFNFTFAGQAFDSVKVRTNGIITFDNDDKYNFVAFYKNFFCEMTTDGHPISPISLAIVILDGGSKIIKIQFSNAAFITSSGTTAHLNYQIWLKEQNNSIEFHMGASDGEISGENAMMGLMSLNNSGGGFYAYLLNGSPEFPSGNLIPASGNNVQLSNIPAPGTVYTFSAN